MNNLPNLDLDMANELFALQLLNNAETAHIEADEILLKLLELAGYNKSVSAYRALRRWHKYGKQ